MARILTKVAVRAILPAGYSPPKISLLARSVCRVFRRSGDKLVVRDGQISIVIFAKRITN